mmetsp:Transcript_78978/g.226355  ORF Transcript_78978/g.226355 Transcript_78978/m.226355 type:complete len:347 (-) Transcript_78978:1509-2549(-)
MRPRRHRRSRRQRRRRGRGVPLRRGRRRGGLVVEAPGEERLHGLRHVPVLVLEGPERLLPGEAHLLERLELSLLRLREALLDEHIRESVNGIVGRGWRSRYVVGFGDAAAGGRVVGCGPALGLRGDAAVAEVEVTSLTGPYAGALGLLGGAAVAYEARLLRLVPLQGMAQGASTQRLGFEVLAVGALVASLHFVVVGTLLGRGVRHVIGRAGLEKPAESSLQRFEGCALFVASLFLDRRARLLLLLRDGNRDLHPTAAFVFVALRRRLAVTVAALWPDAVAAQQGIAGLSLHRPTSFFNLSAIFVDRPPYTVLHPKPLVAGLRALTEHATFLQNRQNATCHGNQQS